MKGLRVAGRRGATLAFVFWLASLGAAAARIAWSDEMQFSEAVDSGSPNWVSLNSNGMHAPETRYSSPLGYEFLPQQPESVLVCDQPPSFAAEATSPCPAVLEPWTLQVMPLGLLYRSYLAGAKEPRFASFWNTDSDRGDLWDAALGGRLGLLRYGTSDPFHPEGWQVDMEGGCQARLDPNSESTRLHATDFRVGIPVTWAQGRWQFKTGYYHISSHLGDEFLLLNPTARRLNYTRDAMLLAVGFFYTERLRLYGETAYAFSATDGAEPLEFQFGADWAPARDTGVRGSPFAAVNGHLREEVDFGGNLVLQAGWAWRGLARGSLFRVGVEYYRGKSEQYEFYDLSEERIGWGVWVDF